MGSRYKTLLAITVVIFATIVLHYVGWLKPLEIFIRNLTNPVAESFYSISINGEEEYFDSTEELEKSYTELKQSHINNLVDRSQIEILRMENNELRELLEFHQSHEYRHETARVIGKNVDPLGSTLLINKGKNQGIKEGSPVIVGNGILIGIVSSANDGSSVVRLVNDNQSKIAATILNEEKSIGLVEGGFGISVQMKFIPQNEKIEIDDLIVTSGLTKNIPRGLLIGTVEAVEREAYQPFQKAILTPAANLNKIFLLSVIIL